LGRVTTPPKGAWEALCAELSFFFLREPGRLFAQSYLLSLRKKRGSLRRVTSSLKEKERPLPKEPLPLRKERTLPKEPPRLLKEERRTLPKEPPRLP